MSVKDEPRRLTCEVYNSQHINRLDCVYIHKIILAEHFFVNLTPSCVRIAFDCFFMASLEERLFREPASCRHKCQQEPARQGVCREASSEAFFREVEIRLAMAVLKVGVRQGLKYCQ